MADGMDSNKYDRQLRLWGANGQRALMTSHILLITAGPTGTETLKNLVLPGVGRFTIMDAAKVQERDLGNNFFVTEEHLGRPRAEVTCELLLELNPDVNGDFRVADVASVIEEEPQYFSTFNLVIATQLAAGPLAKLAEICWDSHTPLLVCRSYGLICYVRTQLRDHCIVESKPESDQSELRIAAPWPELEAHCSAVDLAKLDSKEHSHTPYVVLMFQAIAAWKAQHGGQLPASFEEKRKFQQTIKDMARDFDNEINFQEASEHYYKAYTLPCVPEEIQALLAEAQAHDLTPQSSSFRVLLRALADFVAQEGGGLLPLPGDIPDMTSDTDSFVALQALYKAKAARDAAALATHAARHLAALGRPASTIAPDDVALFAKNAHCLLSVTTSALKQELAADASSSAAEGVAEAMEDPAELPAQTPICWYLALRAADRFQAKRGRWPGETAATIALDNQAVWAELQALVKELGVGKGPLGLAHAREVVRAGASEVHCVASVVGGIASQEAVKVVTRQYAPLDNTAVYNGVAGVLGVYKL
ncbi:NEDD8 activating enzyme E1 subunit 1 [Tribonema minus]|uniref:NEDD8-activating enzyme E1 regulatory subunit n=1 Tax=Tribonema minus TaxID=303371 RepID=A0A836CIV0_9STRA|nr:NEDD8 activating enzyme E1 subunit 1 [Tribonema minus]